MSCARSGAPRTRCCNSWRFPTSASPPDKRAADLRDDRPDQRAALARPFRALVRFAASSCSATPPCSKATRAATSSLQQAETLVEAAIEECERFYPVFQFVLWADKTPQEAIAAALIETQGEA